MKISSDINKYIPQNAMCPAIRTNGNAHREDICCEKSTLCPAYYHPFFLGKASLNNSVVKKINIESAKQNLLKTLDNILKNDITTQEMTKEELNLYFLEKTNEHFSRIGARLRRLQDEMDVMNLYKGRMPQSFYELKNRLHKELVRTRKSFNAPFELKPPKTAKTDTDTDFVLINKFKSAVSDDNFDLKRIYEEHYSGLNDIKSLRELKQKYPKIKLPTNPKVLVSAKIETALTRDFYEEMDRISRSSSDGSKEPVSEFVAQSVKNLLDEYLKKSTQEERNEIYRKVIPMSVTRITKKFTELKNTDSIPSAPINRKIKQPILTDTDKKLLTLDYNDFVLHVLREQYLSHKKPNEIAYTYTKGKMGNRQERVLKLSELNGSDYKFNKLPVSIKSLLSSGEELKMAQRDYDRFTNEELLKRLEFHADRQESNERYLDMLVDFASCRYEPEDIAMMKAFLRESDKVLDGEKTLKEAVKYFEHNDICPKGTRRINEIEYKQRITQAKEEHKRYAQLNHIQTKFDDNINLLYTNDMALTAENCAGFRPASLEDAKAKNAELISSIINKYINPENRNELINKDRLALEITRWKKYTSYADNPDSDKEVLKKAVSYGTTKDGKIDSDKAGKYLINYEAVLAYPNSFEYARNREAAEQIMNHFKDNPEKSVEYLCKYDDYLDLSAVEKSKISNILKIFDKKSAFDKTLLEDIIEKEYVKVPTSDVAKQDSAGGKKVTATICPSAKIGIKKYYGFPDCLDYFEKFENALKQFAPKRGRQGIKKLGDKEYELKIMGTDDRLLASNNEYRFEKFDNVGKH